MTIKAQCKANYLSRTLIYALPFNSCGQDLGLN